MYRQILPQILRKITLSGAAVLLVAGLSSCGNKADLYLPEDTATTYRTLHTNTLHTNTEL